MARDVYRFLLRMPTHLRERLTDRDRGVGQEPERRDRGEPARAEPRREPWALSPPGSADIRRLEGDWGADTPREEEHVTFSKNSRRATRRRRLVFGAVAAAVVLTTAMVVGALTLNPKSQTGPRRHSPRRAKRSPAMRHKLARTPTFSPGDPRRQESGEGAATAPDWYMHASPATDISLAAINGSRQDWKTLKARGDAARRQRPLDEPRAGQRGLSAQPVPQPHVYVPNEYIAAGRTAHSVIDPNCNAAKCRYWIANAGGGIWRTDNVLAPQPEWEFVSGEFEHNNTAALELDPNDPTSNASTRARASRTPAAAAASPASASTSRRTAATTGRARSARSTSPAAASARSRSSPATRRRSSSRAARRARAASAAPAATASTAARPSRTRRTSASGARPTAARRSSS